MSKISFEGPMIANNGWKLLGHFALTLPRPYYSLSFDINSHKFWMCSLTNLFFSPILYKLYFSEFLLFWQILMRCMFCFNYLLDFSIPLLSFVFNLLSLDSPSISLDIFLPQFNIILVSSFSMKYLLTMIQHNISLIIYRYLSFIIQSIN